MKLTYPLPLDRPPLRAVPSPDVAAAVALVQRRAERLARQTDRHRAAAAALAEALAQLARAARWS